MLKCCKSSTITWSNLPGSFGPYRRGLRAVAQKRFEVKRLRRQVKLLHGPLIGEIKEVHEVEDVGGVSLGEMAGKVATQKCNVLGFNKVIVDRDRKVGLGACRVSPIVVEERKDAAAVLPFSEECKELAIALQYRVDESRATLLRNLKRFKLLARPNSRNGVQAVFMECGPNVPDFFGRLALQQGILNYRFQFTGCRKGISGHIATGMSSCYIGMINHAIGDDFFS